MEAQPVDVVVIGAGQAGLSAAYHLRRRGFVPAAAGPHEGAHTGARDGAPDDTTSGAPTFVVLDADDAPGGAWQHRWASLRMATVNGIHELPGAPVPTRSPRSPTRSGWPDVW